MNGFTGIFPCVPLVCINHISIAKGNEVSVQRVAFMPISIYNQHKIINATDIPPHTHIWCLYTERMSLSGMTDGLPSAVPVPGQCLQLGSRSSHSSSPAL